MVKFGGETIALRREPVALVGQGAKLLLELDCRLAIFGKLTQETLKSVQRRAKPHQSLLQSVSLGHHELCPLTAPASPRATTLSPMTGDYTTMVTAAPMVNTYTVFSSHPSPTL